MKKVTLIILLFVSTFIQAQDFETINKIQSSSVESLKSTTYKLVNLTDKKFEFYKEKESQEYYVLVYLPIGLSIEQKEESRINRYDNGIVFRLTKTDKNEFKIKEFYTEPKIMFSIVNYLFYPNANQNDFLNNAKYRSYINNDKGEKFYFHSGDTFESDYKFYSY